MVQIMEMTTMETTTMEKTTAKNQFQIYFLPIPEQKRHRNLFRMHPGNKAALSVPWCARCKRVETGVEHLVKSTYLFRGFGPCSFYLDFWYVLVKIYLGDPYVRRNIGSFTICILQHAICIWRKFLRNIDVSSKSF